MIRVLPYLLPLMLAFYAGWDIKGKYADKIILEMRLELAVANAKTKATEGDWKAKLAKVEAHHEETSRTLAARYAAARLRAQAVIVPQPATPAADSGQAAGGDGLPQRVGGLEVAEQDILRLLQAADDNTQSLMACQAYHEIIAAPR